MNLEGKITHGDAYELLPKVELDSVRLMLTDPPYLVGRKNNLYTMGRKGIEWNWDYEHDQSHFLGLAAPCVMPGGSVVIWDDWKKLGNTARTLEALGFEPKRILTWVKSNPMPRNMNRSFVQATEHALWAVKKGAKWVFNKREGSYETGVFEAPVQRSKHPAKKPDNIFRDLIYILSNPGDLVLDPFAGSGTTAKQAELLGRRHISFEKDASYLEEVT